MARGYLTEDVKVTAAAPTVTGTTTIDTAEVDMAGWDGVLFVVRFGTPASNNNIRGQQDVVTGMAGAADLAGTLVNHATNAVHMLDLQRPQERFIRCRVTRGTSTTIDTMLVLQYRGRNKPPTQPTSVLEQFTGPAEGTA